jgi:hypothetical protein
MFYLSKLQFEIELLDHHAPAGYWGSRLRGGYGDMLLAGYSDQPELFQCLFKPHRDLFERPPVGPPLGGNRDLPPPFVIDPPLESKEGLPRGGRVSFSLVALGPTLSQIDNVIEAFIRLGDIGLENRERNARYRVLDVRDLLGCGRSLRTHNLTARPIVRDVGRLVAGMLPPVMPDEMLISFTTPVRVMRAGFPPLETVAEEAGTARHPRQPGRTAGKPQTRTPKGIRDFYELILTLADRVGGLWQLYGSEWPGKDEFRQWRDRLLQASRQVELLHLALEKRSYLRYSATQRKYLPVEGFIGTMHLRGDLSPFMELLLIGEIVHLGEATAYGFGQYNLIY